MNTLNFAKDDRVKLEPCPFCGGTDIDPTGWVSAVRSGPACNDCNATADSVAAWNRRHDETPSEFERLIGKENSHV